MKDHTYGATISRVERVGTSTNGNPTFDVFFEDAPTARTQTDASVGYEIDNPEWLGARVMVTVTPSGRIRYVQHVKDHRTTEQKRLAVWLERDES